MFSSSRDRYAYAKLVLADKPVAYWPGFWRPSPFPWPPRPTWPPFPPFPASWWKAWLKGGLADVVGGRNGSLVGAPVHGSGIDAFGSVHFNAQPGQYVEVADADLWSLLPANTGLTVEVWMRPDALQFENAQAAPTDYIHWLGKGIAGEDEWAFRLYSRTNTQNRPNRISFYAFNPAGGEGAGAFSQHGPGSPLELRVGEWQHLVGTLTGFHGWPDPEHPHCAQEGASIYHDGRAIDGVITGDANDSYWGFADAGATEDPAASTLAAPLTLPLSNAPIALQSASGFRTSGTLLVAVEDDAGHFHPVRYSGVSGATLTGCTGNGSGSASIGNRVRQGQWEISPANGAAPLRFGTRDKAQYLPGSLCHIAIYQHVLSAQRAARRRRSNLTPERRASSVPYPGRVIGRRTLGALGCR